MTKKATVYRMVMDKHICPYGLKSIDLLKTQGYEVEDHHITSREETDAFKEMYLPYGEEIANQVLEYHKIHGGVSRYEKFKYWEKKFFDKDIDEEKVDELAKKFSKLVLTKMQP